MAEARSASFDGSEASDVLHDSIPETLELLEDGSATLRLALPLAERGDLVLKRIGAELVVGVADHRRTMLLPPGQRGSDNGLDAVLRLST